MDQLVLAQPGLVSHKKGTSTRARISEVTVTIFVDFEPNEVVKDPHNTGCY
jgi:hypothetical protein